MRQNAGKRVDSVRSGKLFGRNDGGRDSMESENLIRRILLVEDTAQDALIITHHLRKLPLAQRPDIVHVTSLSDAEAELRRSNYDCLLLDLGLPDGRGLDNVRRIRASCVDVAIVVMTGLDDDKLALEALRCGAQEYLVKGKYEGGVLLRALNHAVERHRMVLEIDRQRQRNDFNAGHDMLTGLVNRQLFADRAQEALAQAERRGERLALCFLDLDGFKPVNDALGHAVGDALLKEVARVLTDSVRESDTVARVGGDEFVVLLFPVVGQGEAEAAAQRFVDRINAITSVGGQPVKVGVSGGLSIYPEDGLSLDKLLVRADAAMFAAKRGGRGQLRLDAGPSPSDAHCNAQTPGGVPDETNGALLFQPWWSHETGKCAGVEVLLRQRLGGDLVSPDGMLRSSEELGMLVDLYQWVMNSACQQWVRWRQAGIRPGCLAVHASQPELSRPDFASRTLALLECHDISPSEFRLEVAEGAFDAASLDLLESLRTLRAYGVKIIVDHFGRDIGAIKRLIKMPVDGLKLDRTVVWDLRSGRKPAQVMAEAIVAVAESCGLEVIASGIEEQSDLAQCAALGCKLVQGYLLGPPMGPDRLAGLVYARGAKQPLRLVRDGGAKAS